MQDIKKLLILGVIILFSFLIFPFFLALGYTIRVMKNTTENNDTLPEFDNIGSMFIDGVKLLIVYFIYMLTPLIITGIGLIPIFGLIGIGLATLNPGAIIAALIAALGVYLIFIIIGIMANITVLMIICMAVVNMAHTGKFGAAFRVSEIIQRIKNIGIGTYILWFITLIITYMMVSILLGIVSSIFSIIMFIPIMIIMIIPILGPILGIILYLLIVVLVIVISFPYLFLFVSKSMASIYMKVS